MKRRVIPWAAALGLLTACVSVDEPAVKKGLLRHGQRAVYFLYEAPGPWISMESDTKAESAAKFIPGLGLALQGVQNERDLKVSQSLGQYLPAWSLASALRPYLQSELAKSGVPVRWVEAGPAADVSADDLRRLNKAKNALDWRERYLTMDPDEKAPRNYAGFLQLDDAVIVEFNVQHGLLTDAQNGMYPWATSLVRIYRGGTMRLLWSHEESADLKGSSRNLYDYQSEPRLFLIGIEKLMPVLSQKTGAALAAAFADPTWAPAPPPPPAPPAPSQVLGDTTKVASPPQVTASTSPAAVPMEPAPAVPVETVAASTESAPAQVAASTPAAPGEPAPPPPSSTP